MRVSAVCCLLYTVHGTLYGLLARARPIVIAAAFVSL